MGNGAGKFFEAAGMKPSILQIVPSLNAGGAERTTVDIAAALVREGYKALVASEGGRMEEELARAGGEFIPFPAGSKNPAVIWRNAAVIAAMIRERKIALVHARSRAPAWSALIAARRTGIPFVTTYHGIYNAKGPLKRWYNSVMARGDCTIANSQWTAEHVLKTYPQAKDRLAIIPRGIDLSYFDSSRVSSQKVAAIRQAWRLSGGERVVFLPGRLTRWKGQHVFADAIARLKSAGRWPKDARAVIAGDAQGRDDYAAGVNRAIGQAGLAQCAIVAPHVTDMAAAYLSADIVVSASIEPEAFGRVAAEASAMARPVIATDHGGARETVLQGQSGLLVPPGDAGALGEAIERLLSFTPEQRATMGAKGRSHIAAHFTLERMCADTLAIYKRLIR
jgi:glycosyltransferase involved in cell wall biosynthesis